MKRYKHLFAALLFASLTHFLPPAATAQSVVNMIHNDSIILDACTLGSGSIHDDGGPTGNYSNLFDGYVIIQATPGMTITVTGSYDTEDGCDKLTIHDGTTTLLNEVSGSGTVNVSSTTGQLLIRFHTDGSSVSSGFTLNWSATGLSDVCPNPVVNLDTTSVTTNSIGLTWSATNPAGPFTLVCGDRTVSGITSTSYTLTDLNASTSYNISVVDAASVGDRCCAGHLLVRTACGNASLPYSEGFEGMPEESFPSCWLQATNFDDEDYLPQVVSTQHSSGSRSLLLSCGKTESAGHFGIVATPPLEGVGSHTVRLMLRASHSGTYVEFGTCDSAGSIYNQYGFTPVQSFVVYNTNEWQEYRFTWNSASNGRRLALRMLQSQQNGMARRLYIDDMGIENCGIDSVQAMHVESDQLDLLWSTYGNPTCNVGVRVEGAVADMQTFTAATSPLHISGLSPDTRYVFTVYPTCSGSLNISRSVTARTAAMPVSADGYCSNFSQSTTLPQEWTFLVLSGCGGQFSKNDRNIYYYDGCGNSDAIMASERLTGLAGKQVAVTFEAHDEYSGNTPWASRIVVGTMTYADDPSTFVPIDSVYSDDRHQTFVVTVPANSTGRHIAVRLKSQHSWHQCYISSVSCSDCAVANTKVEHRRGSSMVISWAQPYDTVLVQYGPEGFPLGSGSVDTFYNVRRGTIHGLLPSTEYDLFVYRPCQTPCEDMRYTRRTATRDYPLPYCEDFSSLYSSSWDYNNGDWRSIYSTNNRPSFDPHPYYSLAGRAMTMSSWGYDWGSYSMAMLPDVELDSHSVLSFYVYDQAPQSTILVCAMPDNYYYNDEYTVLDTIHISAYNRRVHYNYTLRPSDTLFNNRLVLMYKHPYEYSYYNCYIDELHIQHQYYGTLRNTHIGFDTATFNLTSLSEADSVVVTLVGGGKTFVDTILLPDIHSFGFGGLDTGTLYLCYVRPVDEGCNSLAGHIITQAFGSISGYGSCFPFSNELSYELPYRWAADTTTRVTTGDYLQLPPLGSLAMHPMTGIADRSFSFRARSHSAPDTLILGVLPADSISVDSTHFGPQIAYFSPIDTFVLGTEWEYHMLRLPSTLSGHVRIVLRAGSDTTDLDELEITSCPIVHFEEDGNQIVCSIDNDQFSNYYLTLDDSAGTDHRVIYVESNPFRITGLQLGMRYDLSWHCPFSETACRPTVSVRTGTSTPLPYCEDFDATSGGSMTVPPSWTFIKRHSGDNIGLVSDGPSLSIQPYYNNRWTYVVLPEFDADSLMSLHAFFHTWNEGAMQIGVMDNATDTSSFVPLWTSSQTGWRWADVELSDYTDKRVAIRVRYQIYLRKVHVYGFPLAKYSLVGSKHIKVTTEHPGPYWLHYRNRYDTSQDTLFYVDSTVFYIHDTNITSNDRVYINQTDSLGYTCEDNREYFLAYKRNLPYCYNSGCYSLRAFDYSPYNQSGASDCYWLPDERKYVNHFYGNSSSWMVLHEPNIDSLKHLGMRMFYNAGSIFDTLVAGVMVDAYDTATFTPLDTIVYTIGDSLQSRFVDFTNYTGTGRWVAFHHLNSPNSLWFEIHNLYMEACPGALSATASLSRWNRVKIDGKKLPFYVEYGHSGMGQSHPDNTIMRIDSVPVILTLDPETRYDFYFRCDSLAYSCAPLQQVVTLAAPMELPTCVDFDTVAPTLIPRNWQRRNPDIGVSSDQSHSGANSLVMPVATNSYIITPDINVDSIQKVAVSLWYKVEDLADRLVVGVMSNPSDMSTFYPVRTLAPVEAGVWQHGMVEFSLAPTESHFIAIRARSNRQGGGRNIYVDDIFVTNCAAFDFTVQKLTNSSIDLTWNHLGNPDITISVIDDGVETATYTNVRPPLHIEPLDMLHYYTFRFSSTCDPDDTGYCSTNYTDSLSVVTPAPGTGCVNPTDLASPQAVFFTGSYRNPYSQAGAVNYGSLHPDSRHTVCYDTAQRDPRTGNQLRTIPEGYTSSVRLGNWSTNYYSPEAEGVIYSLFVDTSSFELLLLRYAAVLQDPMHAPSDQPRFRMELLDTNYNIIDSACTSADFIADQNLGWHSAEDGVLWKDWTAVGVDLSAHAGEQVYFRLTTFDCNEGSHYGYAYFTLECMRKNMNTVSCGDVDSNTLSAPEGFHYRWYTSQSTATVSTEQKIRVPSENITYYCEVSKLDNPSCRFLISAYGGTRYPIADFDTTVTVDSCRFYVTFTNTGGVSRDGSTLIPGERCETTLWDFGNGIVSTAYNGHTVYNHPGVYTVTLVSGIALDACRDTATMVLHLDLPRGMAPSDTTDTSICDNHPYSFFGQQYVTTGTFYHTVPIEGNPCDSLYVLLLDVRPTSLRDTTAHACDSIRWHGNTYTTDGDHLSAPVGLNTVGCDSSMLLHLTVSPTYDTVDTLIICPGFPYSYRGVDYGGPLTFDTTLLSRRECDSVVHVTLRPRDTAFHLRAVYNLGDSLWLQADSVIVGCAPASLLIADSTDSSYSREWQFFTPDTMGTSIMRGLTLDFPRGTSDSVTALVMLRVESEGQCWDTAAWPVVIMPSPQAEFYWIPDLPAMHSPDIQFDNRTLPEPLDSLDFLWQIQSAQSGEDTSTAINPAYSWGKPEDHVSGDKTVRLIAYWHHSVEDSLDHGEWLTDSLLDVLHQPLLNISYPLTHTCPDTAERTVTITNDYLQFPNLVSPNGDGTNDTWMVVNLVEYSNYSMNELWIYDRSGTLVYHVKNIHSHSQDWDPNATNSPDGTYYYRFTAKGMYGIVKRNGIIEVLRD